MALLVECSQPAAGLLALLLEWHPYFTSAPGGNAPLSLYIEGDRIREFDLRFTEDDAEPIEAGGLFGVERQETRETRSRKTMRATFFLVPLSPSLLGWMPSFQCRLLRQASESGDPSGETTRIGDGQSDGFQT